MMVDNVYILDNGAHTAKVELSKAVAPRIIPNCIMKAKSERRRPFIADQVDECRDASGLFYLLPFQKGFLINWDVQKTVWDYIFSKECCYGNFSETPLIVTEPYFNFPSIQEAMSEIFFEEYDCQSLLRINANCSVKEELQHYIEILQFYHEVPKKLDSLESPGHLLRFMSSKVTCEDMKVIFWKENRNPLLCQRFFKDDHIGAVQILKQLWRAKVCNLSHNLFLSELDLVLSLHHHLHIKHRKRGQLELSDYDVSDNFVYDTSTTVDECTATQYDSHTNFAKSLSTESMIKKTFDLEDFCSSNDQPTNYGLKYFECDYPAVVDSVEKPVNYSLKYFEEMESECADVIMFGAGEICYAETDLDHSPDVIFSHLEKGNSGSSNIIDCTLLNDDSHSGIHCPPLVEDEELQTAHVSVTPIIHPGTHLEENVNKNSEVVLLETPLVFSRSSSVSSLASVEPIDDVTSVISDYSRVASGMISPSDLPDSPTQTSAPSILSVNHVAPQKLRSVFEEKVSIFREESTPVQFSSASSLSALVYDDQQIDNKNDLKDHNLSVMASESSSTDGKDDEDILADCISAGMPNVKTRNIENSTSRKQDKAPVDKIYSFRKKKEKNVSLVSVDNSESKSESSGFDVQTFTTDNTPLNMSNMMSYSDFPDHNDILAECIQTGMPTAQRRTKCKFKKSPKVPFSLMSKNKPFQKIDHHGTSSSSDDYRTESNADSRLKVQNTLLNPEICSAGLFMASDTLGKPLLNSPLESNVQLSRRSSIDSIKEDLTEDQVTLSELLLLEQCISSGMPKKKTR